MERTPLYARHEAAGARFVGFAGWEMPVEYRPRGGGGGVREEHLAVRSAAGIFDVSHMARIAVEGPGARQLLQSRLTNDVDRIGAGEGQYTLICTPEGGTIDDLFVYRLDERGERWLVVANASNHRPVLDALRAEAAGEGCVPGAGDGMTSVVDRSRPTIMLAVQGPAAVAAAADAGLTIPDRPFAAVETGPPDAATLVARTGYTGEDGVEVIAPAAGAERLWDALVAAGARPAGLGARDSLRTEVGYCLYGQELTLERTPIEAGVGWACRPAKAGGYVGGDVHARQRADGTAERLVGLELDEGIPRTGHPVLDADGAPAGVVTSGTLSPTLGRPIGLAYVRADLAGAGDGTPVTVDVRGRPRAARLTPRTHYQRAR